MNFNEAAAGANAIYSAIRGLDDGAKPSLDDLLSNPRVGPLKSPSPKAMEFPTSSRKPSDALSASLGGLVCRFRRGSDPLLRSRGQLGGSLKQGIQRP